MPNGGHEDRKEEDEGCVNHEDIRTNIASTRYTTQLCEVITPTRVSKKFPLPNTSARFVLFFLFFLT